MVNDEDGLIKNKLKRIAEAVLNPRYLICYALAWLLTNGWAYIVLFAGMYFDMGKLAVVATAYLSIIWLPFTPEKIITVSIAIFILKRIFPNDEKTLKYLREIKDSMKNKMKKNTKKD